MADEQNKIFAERAFWKSWVTLGSNAANNAGQNEATVKMFEPVRRDAIEYAARVAQQQAEARRIDNLKLIAMVVVGFLAICLIVFLLSLIDMKPELSSANAGGNSQAKEDAELIEASIEEEMIKGGFSSREAYLSSELSKQSFDVGNDIIEFSKKIKSVTPKMNITGLVIAKKMDQLAEARTLNGFGIELVSKGDESDDFRLISHLKGMTSSVEFFAEGGRVVTHFKDYPAGYCAGTKGAAVCGS